MTAQHSRGPFKVEPIDNPLTTRTGYRIRRDDGGGTDPVLALVYDTPDGEVSADEARANADLFAASPAMRAALEKIAAMGPDFEPEPEDYDDTESAYSNGEDVAAYAAAEIARAALAAAPPAPSDAPAPPFRWADGSEGPFTAERDRNDVVTVWDANNRRLFSLNVVTQLPLDDEEALEAEAAEALALASQMADAMNAFERAPADPVKVEMLAALAPLTGPHHGPSLADQLRLAEQLGGTTDPQGIKERQHAIAYSSQVAAQMMAALQTSRDVLAEYAAVAPEGCAADALKDVEAVLARAEGRV